jgi:hypothetical protein
MKPMSKFKSLVIIAIGISQFVVLTSCNKTRTGGSGDEVSSANTIKIGEVQTLTGSEATFIAELNSP